MAESPHLATSRKLLIEVDEIVAMAQELQGRGLRAEAVTFAMIATQRLRTVRMLERLSASHRRGGSAAAERDDG